MNLNAWSKPDPLSNFFSLPKQIYSLGLEAGEIAVYGYLRSLKNRETYQCWPSYKTIGKAVGMSKNTVKKYVASLEEKRFITTESTMVKLRDGRKRNGNLRYTILPIQMAMDYFHERQMAQLELEAERQRAMAKLAKYDRVATQEPLCAALPEAAGTDPDQGCECGFGAGLDELRGTKEKAGERTGVVAPPVRSQTPAVRTFSRLCQRVHRDVFLAHEGLPWRFIVFEDEPFLRPAGLSTAAGMGFWYEFPENCLNLRQ